MSVSQEGGGDDPGATAHERTYRALRERILQGRIAPGRPVTLRGLADALGVSLTPVREAVRRLIAERALDMRDNRRVGVPDMTPGRFGEIVTARLALEPEIAVRALDRGDTGLATTLSAIDDAIDDCLRGGDVDGYMRQNHAFHFTLYGAAGTPVLLGLVESLWLQFGPFMRVVYGRFGTGNLADHHQEAIAAIRAADREGLRRAIAQDIEQGMGLIGEQALRDGG